MSLKEKLERLELLCESNNVKVTTASVRKLAKQAEKLIKQMGGKFRPGEGGAHESGLGWSVSYRADSESKAKRIADRVVRKLGGKPLGPSGGASLSGGATLRHFEYGDVPGAELVVFTWNDGGNYGVPSASLEFLEF
jgi:hypothetical protein